ncbi:MAG: AEC family transporter [Eggerthellaceae bacterium]|jgi:predicted permease
MAVLQQMLIFGILIVVGLFARRFGMITQNNQQQLSSLVVNVTYPALILSSALSAGERLDNGALLTALGATVALIALALVAGWLLPIVLRYPRERRSIFTLMTVFTNIGFMGVPMIRGLYGNDALIYMTIFLIPFNLMFYAYAIPKLQGKIGKKGAFKPRDLLNAGMVSCALAIVFYLANIPVPEFVSSAVDMVGSMTAPLGMMLLGSFLTDVNWKTLATDVRIWLFTGIKMFVVPVVIVWILSFFIQDRILLAVCLAAIATPSGNVLALLANLYNPALADDAVKGIALTTVVSLVSMTACFMVLGLS